MEMVANVVSLVVLSILVIAFHAEALPCTKISGDLAPCVGYLRRGGPVPPNCCKGVQNINNSVRTTPDRKAACKCLKSLAGKTRGIDFSNAAGLPGKCGVNIPYKISLSTDCSKVQ